jgi:LCP family protein required for cell wall assembly
MGTANGDGRDPMSEWPEGWFRDGNDSADAGAPGDSGGVGADRTVSIPSSQHPGGQYQAGQYAADPGGYGAAAQRPVPPGSWPQQPPISSSGSGGDYGAGGSYGGGLAAPARSPSRSGGPSLPGGPRWRRWLRPRRIFGVLAVIVALLLVAGVGTYFYLNSKLTRSNILVNYPGRPSPGSGTNWLIAGSDSRQGLSKREERRLSTGNLDSVGPGRSDTIMILHIPAGGGRPLLISVPRDSYVDIPGFGWNKINAAFSFGGPKLLAETVQKNTGLYINHFMDIGFGGFVHVVNAVGGVRMCLIHKLHDRASGLYLPRGCHVLNGAEALEYVRDRHDFLTQDLQREQDQRIFLKALLSKLTSPGVMLNPFAALPAASGVVDTLTVDQGTSLYQLFGVAEAMRNPETTTVPIANANDLTSAGDAVQWNASAAKELFTDLQTGQTIPKALISGSHQGR